MPGRPRSLCALTILALIFAMGSAGADPGKRHGRDQVRAGQEYRYQYRDGECTQKVKSGRHGTAVKTKCKPGARRGGPPPWAPAHGYRAGPGVQSAYVSPVDLGSGRCNRDLVGGLLGAAAGAVLGSNIGKGDGRTAAIIGGAVLGALVGGEIGRTMDAADQSCVGQALEQAHDGQVITWNNPNRDARYQVVPSQTYQRPDGQYCREYTATATIGGKAETTYGRACRQPDGSWKIQG